MRIWFARLVWCEMVRNDRVYHTGATVEITDDSARLRVEIMGEAWVTDRDLVRMLRVGSARLVDLPDNALWEDSFDGHNILRGLDDPRC